MIRPILLQLVLVLSLALPTMAEAPDPKPASKKRASTSSKKTTEANWPCFRGVGASGIAEGFALPRKWDTASGKGVRWKTELPGLGLSSPIVWGDRIFLTTAVRAEGPEELKVGLYGDIQPVEDDSTHSWQVICLDKKTGAVLWEKVAHEGVPKIKRHPKCSHANSTAVTDGRHVVAMFGSEGLYCYDMNGKLLWKKDFGVLDSGFFSVPDAQWGYGSSPIIHDGLLILQCDVQKDSFIAAFNLKDGREIWRTPRDEVPTWSSPSVYVDGKQTRLVANGYKHIGGYDFRTGKEVWKLAGGGDIPVPTPIVAHGLIYITNAHGWMAPIYAIKTSATGEIVLKQDGDTNEHVAWWGARIGNYMQTPLVYGDYLYSCMDNGVLSCFDARTGQRIYRQRLGKGMSGFTASGVAGDEKLYYTSEDGDVYVVKPGIDFKLLATNSMGEPCMATPAISEGVLYIRGQKHLFAIENTRKTKSAEKKAAE